MRVLDVGGGEEDRLPDLYIGWERLRLDIDPQCKPDICMDARDLPIEGQKFDAVYCSHNLEHFHRHDALKVLKGFVQSLNEDGYAHILVPDIGEVMRQFVYGGMDIESRLYESIGGSPITAHDMMYGWGGPIEHGNEFYAHKTGFTLPLLRRMIEAAGFRMMESCENKSQFEIEVFAYLKE